MVNAWQMLSLGLDYVLATISFFIFLFFIRKISTSRKTTKETYPFLGLALLAFFMGIAIIFSSWFDYYRWQYSTVVDLIYKFYVISLIAAFIALGFFIENVLKKTKYAITIYHVCSRRLAPEGAR